MNDIILIGGGGHCRSVIDVIEQESRYKIAGIIDKVELVGSSVLGYPVIGSDTDLEDYAKIYKNAIITLGHHEFFLIRLKLFEIAKNFGFFFPSIISPRAYVSKFSKIGNGSIIMHDVLINSNVSIGNNCIINSKALIEHDCQISDNCHISTNAIINGNVKIESNSFVGSNSTTKENVVIKKNSFIKAGSLIK
jgi:sugar O-acyltransferase (sialic acid O-acetyltransferase NeuD family)